MVGRVVNISILRVRFSIDVSKADNSSLLSGSTSQICLIVSLDGTYLRERVRRGVTMSSCYQPPRKMIMIIVETKVVL